MWTCARSPKTLMITKRYVFPMHCFAAGFPHTSPRGGLETVRLTKPNSFFALELNVPFKTLRLCSSLWLDGRRLNVKHILPVRKELPLDDLQEECLRLSLSWRVDQAGKLVILFALGSCCVWRNVFKRNVTRSLQDGLSSHQQQQELCERLVGPSVAAKLLDHFGLQCLKLLEGPITSVLAVAHVEVVAARARLYARTRF